MPFNSQFQLFISLLWNNIIFTITIKNKIAYLTAAKGALVRKISYHSSSSSNFGVVILGAPPRILLASRKYHCGLSVWFFYTSETTNLWCIVLSWIVCSRVVLHFELMYFFPFPPLSIRITGLISDGTPLLIRFNFLITLIAVHSNYISLWLTIKVLG